MTNNLQVFLDIRDKSDKLCDCDPRAMKCGGDPVYCIKKLHREFQGKMKMVLDIFTKEERNELTMIDGTEYLDTQYSQSDEYQLFLEQHRQKTIDELLLPENQWRIKELGIII